MTSKKKTTWDTKVCSRIQYRFSILTRVSRNPGTSARAGFSVLSRPDLTRVSRNPGTRARAGCCPRLWRPLSSGFHGASLKPAHLSPQHLLRTETTQPGHGETASRYGDTGLCVWAAGCPHCTADGPVREWAPEHRPQGNCPPAPTTGKAASSARSQESFVSFLNNETGGRLGQGL